MTDVRKNYPNKYSCHLCTVCKLEKEAMYHFVACNVKIPFEDFGNVFELVALAVRESVNTRNRFIWISNTYAIIWMFFRLTWIRVLREV